MKESPTGLLRILALIAALVLSSFGFLVIMNQARTGFYLFGLVVGGCSLVIATYAWWYFLKIKDPQHSKRIKRTGLIGFVIGAISFAAGFFGPILLTPESNQGPLLGIFITGPLGTAAGLIIGAIYSFIKYPNRTNGPSDIA